MLGQSPPLEQQRSYHGVLYEPDKPAAGVGDRDLNVLARTSASAHEKNRTPVQRAALEQMPAGVGGEAIAVNAVEPIRCPAPSRKIPRCQPRVFEQAQSLRSESVPSAAASRCNAYYAAANASQPTNQQQRQAKHVLVSSGQRACVCVNPAPSDSARAGHSTHGRTAPSA